ncbi:MAG: hypothetical protein GWO02_02135 [Gammaproteobacteria bacterium]|nr:hypothetical protein [Gammaproteobacteria bacterium]
MRSTAALALAGALLAVLAGIGGARAAEPTGAPTLREIMRHLHHDLSDVHRGLMYEDYSLIARAARSIAEHPPIRVPERRLIEQRLGEETAAFAGLDEEVHDRSLAIAGAARAERLDEIVRHSRSLVDSCVACHQAFRERLRGISGARR